MNSGRIALFSFTGTDRALSFAVAEATRRADDWLTMHQWQDTSGQSAYRMHTSAHMDGEWHVYIIHLTGPSEPTEVGDAD